MTWPLSQDYNEAIQSPARNFTDPDLKRGEVVTNALGLPMPYSGNFADVYQVKCPDGTRWAVKCFTRETPNLRERYAEISKHLRQAKLPFTVDFTYLEQGIRVAGRWYPVLKMQWVEGLTLNQFVAQALDKPATLEALLHLWAKMARYLRASGAAHCDLQHGNVLLVPGAGTTSLSLKLIDYDGMFVPALAGTPSGEVGHPSYQHPQRQSEGIYNLEVDRFPLLLVATALTALKVKGRALWEKYDNGDNMLFKEEDLKAPTKSPLFAELIRSGDPTITPLIDHVLKSLKGGMASAPLLEEVLPESRPAPAPARAPRPAAAPPPVRVKSAAPAPAPEAEAGWAEELTPAQRRSAAPGGAARALPLVVWIGAVAAVVVLGVVVGAVILLRGTPTDTEPRVAENRTVPERGTGRQTAAARTSPEEVEETAREPIPSKREPVVPPRATSPATRAEPVSTGKGRPDPVPPEKPEVAIDPNPKGSPGEVRRFEGHTEMIRDLAVSPDGKQLLTASSDNTLRLWDVAAGREVHQWQGHGGKALAGVAFLPDGLRALSAGLDKSVRLWNLKDARELRAYPGETAGVVHVAVSRDGRIAAWGGFGTTVFLGEVETGEELHRLEGHTGGVESLAFSPDGKYLLTGGAGSSQVPVRLWEVATGKEVRPFQGTHAGSVMGLAFTPDGKLALSGSLDKTIRVWSVENGREVRRFEGVSVPVYGMGLSPDGRRMLSGHEDGSVVLWDVEGGKELHRFQGSKESVWPVVFSPDGRHAYSAGRDKFVRMWRLPSAAATPEKPDVAIDPDPKGPPGEVRRFEGHTDMIRDLDIAPNGRELLTASADRTVRLWDVATDREPLKRYGPPGEKMHAVAFFPDGKKALYAGAFGKALQIWDFGSTRQTSAFLGHTGDIWRLAISRDGRVAASCGSESTVFLWDVAAGTVLRRLEGLKGGSMSLAFSPNGKYLLTGGEGSASDEVLIRLWDVETGKPVRSFHTPHLGNVMGLAFSPDGKSALSCGLDKTIRVWRVEDGREVRRFAGVAAPVNGLALSGDGKRLLSAHEDGSVCLWDVEGGKELHRFSGSKSSVMCVAFSPDGKYGYSAGWDKVARMWRLPATGTPMTPMPPSEVKPVVAKRSDKPAVPDEADLVAAEKTVREIFKTDLEKRKNAEELQKLVTRLIQEGIGTRDKPAHRFVLFRFARDVAARAGDFPLSFQGAREMSNHFDIDFSRAKADGVEAGLRSATTTTAKAIAAAYALSVSDDAEESDDYETAGRIAKSAAAAMAGTGVTPTKAAADRVTAIEAIRKAYETSVEALQTLASKPNDAAANLAAGKFHALIRGDWDRGLSHLLKGSDAKLKALAERDYQGPGDGTAARELADEYAALAEQESGAAKTNLQYRAHYWYRVAEVKLEGIDRSTLAKKTTEFEKKLPPSRAVVLHARYGAHIGWADLTDRIRVFVFTARSQKLSFTRGAADLGIPDPAFGEHKSLVVVYRHRGGVHLSITGDADPVNLPAAAGTPFTEPGRLAAGQELGILAAKWGNENKYNDGTAKTQAAVSGATLNAAADALGLGDPYFGRKKSFIIVYRQNGRIRLSTTAEAVRLGPDAPSP